MSSQFARDGRRRRVLTEESRIAAAWQAPAGVVDPPAEAPRYGELASIEHHPQISDYVPRRKRAVVAVLAAGAIVAMAVQALGHFADSLAASLTGVTAEQIRDGVAGGLTAWTAAIAMLAIAGLARLAYSLRRHRVEDVRGQYRTWAWIAWGSLALSCNAVVGFHTVAANVAKGVTGWSLTAGGAEWWLTPAALVGAWLGWGLLREASESRGALVMFVIAAVWYAAAAAGSLGWAPAPLGAWGDALVVAAPLIGHAFALAAMMIFARYVVLDVQGLVDHAPRRAAKSPAQSEPVKSAETPAAVSVRPNDATDATEADDDGDDEADAETRYLSKSERKRLRKQQRRAA